MAAFNTFSILKPMMKDTYSSKKQKKKEPKDLSKTLPKLLKIKGIK